MKNQTGGNQIRGRPHPKGRRTADRTATFARDHAVKPPPQPRAGWIPQLLLRLVTLIVPHLPSPRR